MIKGLIFLFSFFLIAQNTWAECLIDASGKRVCDSSHSESLDNITSPGFMIPLVRLDPIGSRSSVPTGAGAIPALLEIFSNFLFILMPLIAAVSLIVAGYFYILSSGDSEKANRAKTIIKWNVVAISLALFSYVIINFIASILSKA